MQEEDFENATFVVCHQRNRTHFIIRKEIGIDPDLTFEDMGIYYHLCCKEEDQEECNIDENKYGGSIKRLRQKKYIKQD